MKHNYLNKSKIVSCMCGTSLSSVLGNVTALTRDYFQSIFPKGYIKSIYIDTKDISEELQESDVFRKEKPILTIKPKFDFNAENGIMGRLPDWHYRNYFIFEQPEFHYVPVFGDINQHFYLYSIPERMKVTFDISLIFSTRMEAMNAAYYFRGSALQKSYFYLNDVYLETEIPKSMIKTIADANGYDLDDVNDKAKFLDYLNDYSLNRIERKTKLSSGIEQFFYKYKVNVLAIYPDYPEVDDGESNGMTESNYRLTTTLELEFTCPFNYILQSGRDIKVSELDEEEMKYLLKDEFVINTTIPKTPKPEKITVVEEEEKVKEEKKKLVLWEGYIADSDMLDVLDITPVLCEGIQLIIKYCLDEKNNTPINDLFETELYRGKYKMNQEDYKIDWSTREIINMKPIKDETYHFGIYLNTSKGNEILEKFDRRDLYIERELKIVK